MFNINLHSSKINHPLLDYIDVEKMTEKSNIPRSAVRLTPISALIVYCLSSYVTDLDINQEKVNLIEFISKNSEWAKRIIDQKDTIGIKKLLCFVYPFLFKGIDSIMDIVSCSGCGSFMVGGYRVAYYSNSLRVFAESNDIDSFSDYISYVSTLDEDRSDICDTLFACLYGIYLSVQSEVSWYMEDKQVPMKFSISRESVHPEIIQEIRHNHTRVSNTIVSWVRENMNTFKSLYHGIITPGQSIGSMIIETEEYKRRISSALIFFIDSETGGIDFHKAYIYCSALLQVMSIGTYHEVHDSELISVIYGLSEKELPRAFELYTTFGHYLLTCQEISRLLVHPIDLFDEQIDSVKILFSVRLRTRYAQVFLDDSSELPKSYLNTAATGTGKSVIVLYYIHVTMQKLVLIGDDDIGLSWYKQSERLGTNIPFVQIISSNTKMRDIDNVITEIPSITYECLRKDNLLITMNRDQDGYGMSVKEQIQEYNTLYNPTPLLLDLINSDALFVFDEFHKAAGIDSISISDGTLTFNAVKFISETVKFSPSLSMIVGLTATPGEDIDTHMWKLVDLLGFGPSKAFGAEDRLFKTKSALVTLYNKTYLQELDHTFIKEGSPEFDADYTFSYNVPCYMYTNIILRYYTGSIFGVKRPKAKRVIVHPSIEYCERIIRERASFDNRESKDYTILMQLTESAKADVLTHYLSKRLLERNEKKYIVFVNYLNTFNVISEGFRTYFGNTKVHIKYDTSLGKNTSSTPGLIKIMLDNDNQNTDEIEIVCINGNVPTKTRTKRIAEFQKRDLKTKILVVSAKSGSIGVDYGDDYGDRQREVNILPHYSFKACCQMLGRAHRRTSKSQPINYILFTPNDPSEFIMHHRLDKKGYTSKLFVKQSNDYEDDPNIIEEVDEDLVMR